jgi:hypothetical protein
MLPLLGEPKVRAQEETAKPNEFVSLQVVLELSISSKPWSVYSGWAFLDPLSREQITEVPSSPVDLHSSNSSSEYV